MPQNSRYTNAEFETLMNKVILTLEENDAGRDLSLMVLGNVITHIYRLRLVLTNAKPWQISLLMCSRRVFKVK